MGSSGIVPVLTTVSLLVAIGASATAAGGNPQIGCYLRVYDAKHLRVHKGQFVRKVMLSIEPLRPVQIASGHKDIVGDAHLRIRVKGNKAVFASFGVCKEKDGGYDCTGHDKANEHVTCKASTPGVHNCRTPARAEKFRLETRPEGILITIPADLELDAGDTGPYLNLMSSDRQNSEFLVSRARSSADCAKGK